MGLTFQNGNDMKNKLFLFLFLIPLISNSQVCSRLIASQGPASGSPKNIAWISPDTIIGVPFRIYCSSLDSIKLKQFTIEHLQDSLNLRYRISQSDDKYATKNGTSSQYIAGDGSKINFPTIPGGTVTSVALSSSNLNVSGSPITTSGAITVNLPNTITAGTYASATFDATGRATSGLNWTFPTSTGARSFNTAYRESTTNLYNVALSSQIACNLSLTGGQAGTITLEISPNGTSGWVAVGTLSASNTGTLTIGLNTTQISGGQLSYDVPATYYWRLTTNNTTGTPTYTFNGGVYKILQ